MNTATCRLPDRESDVVEQAAEERGAFKSEIVRRAIRYYINQNPDGIRAFSAGSGGRRSKQSGSEAGQGEPAEETVDEAAVSGGGTYDPTEEI